MLYFGFLPPLKLAFSGFFIGRGKTSIITITVLTGSIINVFLDIIMIFGYGIFPKMGAYGAALATIIAEAAQIVILIAIFFNKQNRQQYLTAKTFSLKFNIAIFLQCIKIGTPLSIGRFLEIVAWYIVVSVVSQISQTITAAYSISLNIYFFFIFFADSFSKAILALSSNLIGAEDLAGIENLKKMFLSMTMCVGLVLLFPLVIFQDMIFAFLDIVPESLAEIKPLISPALKILYLNLILEIIVGVFMGILTSGGDTKYPSFINITLLWVMVVIPVILMFATNTLNSVVQVYSLSSGWCVMTFFIMYKRYKSLKWYKKLV